MESSASPASTLRGRRSLQFQSYLAQLDSPFAQVVGVSQAEWMEWVDLEVEVELPRDPVYPIQARESVRVGFDIEDRREPIVIATRADFPVDLPHTTLGLGGASDSLCLWEVAWAELKRRLSAEELLARIRWWFAQTAAGTLHEPDQPLEPLLPATHDSLILPAGGLAPGVEHHVVRAEQVGRAYIVELSPTAPPNPVNPSLGILTITLPEAPHGALRLSIPTTLEALVRLCTDRQFDLLAHLSQVLVRDFATPKALKQRLLIILQIPKSRVAGEAAESVEVHSFLTVASAAEVGEALGVFLVDNAGAHVRIGGSCGDISGFAIAPWRIVQRLDRAAAADLGGGSVDDRRIVAVGAGALGSNLIPLAARAGFGRWAVIDDDIVMPHNTVRQGQGDWAVGHPKVLTLQHLTNQILAEPTIDKTLFDDVISPREAEAVAAALAGADLVVDLSASPAVLGRLSDGPGPGRRGSLFFNPDGHDLVLLLEDAERVVRLDALEAQYYAAVAFGGPLDGHLDGARAGLVRYSNVCRDISRPLPPWRVACLSAIGAAQLQAATCASTARIAVWRMDPHGGVRAHDAPVAPVLTAEVAGWRLTLSSELVASLRAQRLAALPAETGGVLMGVADLDRKVLHLVDAVAAPPDSVQTPTYFERGVRGLRRAVEARQLRTAGHLDYAGEWHSHPKGARARPSPEDEGVHAHLTKVLGAPGRAFVMVILGDRELWVRFAYGMEEPVEHVFRLDSQVADGRE